MRHLLSSSQSRFIEVSLVLSIFGIGCLTHLMPTQKSTVLYLFFLAVILGGFFLGRYRAGVLALLSVVLTTIVVMSDFHSFLLPPHPLTVFLQLAVWAAVLGLAAVLVGTLSDDRELKRDEAREAQHGVVDVLRAYLQSINPRLQSQTQRVMEICDRLGKQLNLGEMELEDMRVAALLVDLEPVEITSRAIRQAVDQLQEDPSPRTFAGSELVCSLGNVLTSAFPIAQWVTQDHRVSNPERRAPVTAEIIRAARAYDLRLHSTFRPADSTPLDVWQEMQQDDGLNLPDPVLQALHRVITSGSTSRISLGTMPRRAATTAQLN
ncbi:hypothetical protein GC163_06790 [bacterium]|nr:hypothetical protein [bacterium]